MHYIYEAYTKEVNGVVHYFVKRYLRIPELKQVPDLMEGFGMHQDFHKACHIAGVADQQQINQLFGQVNQPTEAAKSDRYDGFECPGRITFQCNLEVI